MLAVLGVLALLGLILAGGANAATYTNPCVATDPVCERLTAVVAAIEALPQTDTEYDYSTVLAAIDGNTAGTGEISGTVALSAADRERLDLSWWGVWAVGGLLLVVVLAPRWFAAFRITHGL